MIAFACQQCGMKFEPVIQSSFSSSSSFTLFLAALKPLAAALRYHFRASSRSRIVPMPFSWHRPRANMAGYNRLWEDQAWHEAEVRRLAVSTGLPCQFFPRR